MIRSRRKKPRRMKVKAKWWHWPWFHSTWSKVLLTLGIFASVAISFVLIDTYKQFSRQIDRKISGEIFLNTAKVYAAPLEVYPGQPIGLSQVREYLDAAGYAPHDQEDPSLGRYTAGGEGLEIFPGDQAYGGSSTAVRIEFDEDGIESIVSLADESLLEFYDLEPRLITHLFDKSREKRRLIEYWEIPQVLRDAVLAIEDRRFFSHYGFDPIALIGVALGGFERGASTITQQLVRSSSFWLTRERRVIRKAKEIYMSTILETRLSKEQIFTLYSNDIYLGQSGSFSINGFGEAATAYFNKDIKDLTLPEAALLAGLIQSPNRYSPTRRPERALRRRNVVLMAMLETGSITSEQYQVAVKAPLEVAPHSVDQNDAPYFVDMLKDRLLKTYSDEELLTKRYKVYTTLDCRPASHCLPGGAGRRRAGRSNPSPSAPPWTQGQMGSILLPQIRNRSRGPGASLPDRPGFHYRRDSSAGGRPGLWPQPIESRDLRQAATRLHLQALRLRGCDQFGHGTDRTSGHGLDHGGRRQDGLQLQ